MANFNIPPYFDDYDESKGFYKVLFRPSVAVQARELNQMQTMLQKQIERFGSHIFREGSIVVGGGFDLELDISYVRATSVTPSIASLPSFVGKTIVGTTSGIRAVVRAVEYDTGANVSVFLIRYLSASTTSDVFLDSESVQVEDDASLYFQVTPSSSTGTGSIFSIASGVVFTKGYFLAFPAQTIVLSKYTNTPTLTIGLQVTESFVTELEDTTLLDNAAGSYNENAPGAHRYALEATLTSIDYRTGYEDPNFINLMSIKEGVVEVSEERSQYARIYDELAKRTFDESGDYYVRGLDVRTREHLDTGSNEGLFSANANGNSSLLSIDIEPGIAYVKGYEVNKLITEHIPTEKALTYNFVDEQLVNSRTGGYFLVKELVGFPDLDEGTIVNLYGTAETRVTLSVSNTTTPTTAAIGTARIKSIIYESGSPGSSTGTFRVYVYDINFNATKGLSDVKAIGSTTTGNKFFGDVVLTNVSGTNTAILVDQNLNTLIFPLGSPHTRTIRSQDGSVATTFDFNRTENKTVAFNPANGLITTTVTSTGEQLKYGSGWLSTTEKRTVFVTMDSTFDISLPGVVSNTSANALSGSGTSFTKLSVGDRIKIGSAGYYYISKINNNNSLELANNLTTSVASNVFFKTLLSGDVIDLTARGSSGVTRTANVTSGVLTIDLQEDISNTASPTSASVKITYAVNRVAAGEIKKILRSNRFVQIQASTNPAGVTGPYNLGLTDVYKIRYVRMHSSSFSSETDGTDVTSSFTLDNGQKDNIYDHAKIYNTGNLNLAGKYLLVKLDHFEPDYSGGVGYFSVDSYPIDDTQETDSSIFTYQIPKYKTTGGEEYNLRDVFDFRQVKVATAVSAITPGTATLNPATTTSLITDVNGLRTPIPDSIISSDYSYYLARRDVVTLDKQGKFNVIKGEPAVTPISPNVPDNVMGIANIYVPPYPSVSETLARIINDRKIGCSSKKIANIRYTMREIGVLKNRIENLEYYNALSLLEKSAVDLKVPDQDGLDRFKNGFFVDGFLDHSLGATYNPDYKIAVDKIEQAIRPKFEMDSFKYQYNSGSGTQVTGSVITRPYVSDPAVNANVVLLENKNVTTYRNIEQSVFRFIGTIDLTPDNDAWCDTTTVDKKIEFGNDLNVDQIMKTEWGSWETYAVGYNVYDRNVGDRSGTVDPNKFLGSYNSYAAAVAATKTTPYYSNNKKQSGTDSRALIETISSDKRVGIQTSVTTETQTQELGNFVTDVSLIPYIRPQVIQVYTKGLKANTLYYIYFDGENMSDYIVPMVIPEDGDITAATQYLPEGTEWRSDEYGQLLGFLRLPNEGKRFRVGSKEVIITDSPTNAIDATSYAKSYFTASGISVQKQNTIISTKVPVIQQKEIVETKQKQKVEVMGPSCMAYSFKVDVPRGEDGVFLTSVDVWIQAKHANLGVWFEIREMNGGNITRTQVPYSEVWYKNNQVTTWNGNPATESTNFHRVTFPAPVFLMNDTQYAFVIHTEGLNPDYYFWVSRLGETDIITQKQVTGRQLTGTLFTTNNNLNYDMVPDVDLKVRFNRAVFTPGVGTAYFGNKPVEFIKTQTGSNNFIRYGETIIASEKVSVSNTVSVPAGNTISIGDKIVGTTSSITANVISTATPYYSTDNLGFVVGETYNVYDSSNTAKNITGTILTIDGGMGTLRSYNPDTNLMVLDDSNGKFFANAVIRGLTSNNVARIDSFSYYPYSTTTLKPNYLIFNSTSCTFEKRGYNTISSGFGNWYPGTSDSYSSFNEENRIMSRVDEIGSFSGNATAEFKATLTTASQYVSPVVDLNRAQSIFVHNIINDDDPDVLTLANTTVGANTVVVGDKIVANSSVVQGVVTTANVVSVVGNVVITDTNGFRAGEIYTVQTSAGVSKGISNTITTVVQTENLSSGGNLLNKYISKTVTLADGQDAEDILVKLTAYKPNGSDVKVWIKIKHGEDSEAFDQKPWILLDYNQNFYSSAANQSDFIEIDYTVPAAYQGTYNGTADVIKYTSGGTTFYTFKQYAVKIGLIGTNSANVPRVGDLRVIALQK